MAKSIRMDDDFVSNAEVHAQASNRSLPKQIEHWAKIGCIAEDNPDLSYEFIKDAILAREQIKAGQFTSYERKKER